MEWNHSSHKFIVVSVFVLFFFFFSFTARFAYGTERHTPEIWRIFRNEEKSNRNIYFLFWAWARAMAQPAVVSGFFLLPSLALGSLKTKLHREYMRFFRCSFSYRWVVRHTGLIWCGVWVCAQFQIFRHRCIKMKMWKNRLFLCYELVCAIFALPFLVRSNVCPFHSLFFEYS